MDWLKNVEPTIADMLSDPMMLKFLARSGRPAEIMRELCDSVACSRSAAVAPASPAQPQAALQVSKTPEVALR
jgi:hypothetical protein